MPEGPSIVILKEACQPFAGKKIIRVSGNSKARIERLANQTIIEFRSFGKNFFICFKSFSVRIHLMLFGSYRINEAKDATPRLSLQFKKGELNFYSCVVELIEQPLEQLYDWETDVMADQWNPVKVKNLLKEDASAYVCDALLNQHVFAGVGNIIKNEVLFRTRLHPLNMVRALPPKKLSELITQARKYSFDFYEWKKLFGLKKHWLVHHKKICSVCGGVLISAILGKTRRRTFFCDNCQLLYKKSTAGLR
jgi:endonuclease-8